MAEYAALFRSTRYYPLLAAGSALHPDSDFLCFYDHQLNGVPNYYTPEDSTTIPGGEIEKDFGCGARRGRGDSEFSG
jgi:hypothetical protein